MISGRSDENRMSRAMRRRFTVVSATTTLHAASPHFAGTATARIFCPLYAVS